MLERHFNFEMKTYADSKAIKLAKMKGSAYVTWFRHLFPEDDNLLSFPQLSCGPSHYLYVTVLSQAPVDNQMTKVGSQVPLLYQVITSLSSLPNLNKFLFPNERKHACPSLFRYYDVTWYRCSGNTLVNIVVTLSPGVRLLHI